jgi:hypothetical protein
MEEIYESPDVPNITSKITKQKQEITSEFIDNTKLHPDHAFEVMNFFFISFKDII